MYTTIFDMCFLGVVVLYLIYLYVRHRPQNKYKIGLIILGITFLTGVVLGMGLGILFLNVGV